MSGAPDRIAFQSIHQDQVIEAPAGAVRVATSDFCPSAMLAYGSNGYSIQAHPEFTPEFSLALLNVVRGVRIEESVCDRAIKTRRQSHPRAGIFEMGPPLLPAVLRGLTLPLGRDDGFAQP